jgi:BlaI family transcriptional regulator, penicillinase repressor
MNNISCIAKLEAEILLVIWDKGEATVRDVYEVILKKEMKKNKLKFTLYSSIQFNMNNLLKKNILKIDRINKTHIYSAGMDRKELAKSMIMAVAEKLL